MTINDDFYEWTSISDLLTLPHLKTHTEIACALSFTNWFYANELGEIKEAEDTARNTALILLTKHYQDEIKARNSPYENYQPPSDMLNTVDDPGLCNYRWKPSSPPLFTSEIKASEKKRGLPKKDIARAFQGLHFGSGQWLKYLASPPKWLKECRVNIGSRGKQISATWNPVLTAKALMFKGVEFKKLDSVFNLPAKGLKDWKDEWQVETELLR